MAAVGGRRVAAGVDSGVLAHVGRVEFCAVVRHSGDSDLHRDLE